MLLRLKPLRFVVLLGVCVTVLFLLGVFYTREPSIWSPFDSDAFIPPGCDLSNTEEKGQPEPGLAASLSPTKLLCRPLASDLNAVPKLLHQSWKSTELPAKFKRWSNACREKHPDWEWVLWTDDDNLQLVQKYFPWLEDTYLSLPGKIYQADLARNLYMYLFGGVYADLDTECLRSTSDVLEKYHVPTPGSRETASDDDAPLGPVAMFGRMGTDPAFDHHIPNAWMAASPGHPFFLLPLKAARAEIAKSRNPLHKLWYDYPSAEQMTGPIALRASVLRYKSSGQGDDIILLPEQWVYPFDWNTQEAVRAVCSAEHDSFDDGRCKQMLDVDSKGSLSITYWSHTHRGKGSDRKNIDHISHDG